MEGVEDYSSEKKIYYALLSLSFLSTGMLALISFPRSIYLTEMGMPLAIYGMLLSIAAAILLFLQIAIGKIIDKFDNLEQVLKFAALVNTAMHGMFLVTKDIKILAAAFIIEIITSKLFSNFIYTVVTNINGGKNLGRNLGMFKMSGSIAWAVFAALTGFILEFFSYSVLTAIVVVMGIIKLAIISYLFRQSSLHKKKESMNSDEGEKKIVKSKLIYSLPLVNFFLFYMLTQLHSNGGFNYLQIYMKNDIHVSNILSGWVIASSGLFEVPISMLIGKMCDSYNKRFMIIMGFMIASLKWILLSSITDQHYLLFVVQIMHGIFMCTLTISCISYVAKIVPANNLGTAIGMLGSMSSLGSILGAAAFGAAADAVGLSYSYFASGLLGVFSVLLFMLLHKSGGLRRKYQ